MSVTKVIPRGRALELLRRDAEQVALMATALDFMRAAIERGDAEMVERAGQLQVELVEDVLERAAAREARRV